MKYIRTKDGRILESEINDNRKSLGYEPIPFIKQADTIEELCDEFVIENNGHCISDLYTIKRLLVKNKVLVFGAIWTDKGLIYVAKMNDKGELKLL